MAWFIGSWPVTYTPKPRRRSALPNCSRLVSQNSAAAGFELRLGTGNRPGRRASTLKKTLVVRPLELLLSEPHLLSGWISYSGPAFYRDEQDNWQFAVNPLSLLSELYHFLNMDADPRTQQPQIWSHDQEILDQGLAFYADLAELVGTQDWSELQDAIVEGAILRSKTGVLSRSHTPSSNSA